MIYLISSCVSSKKETSNEQLLFRNFLTYDLSKAITTWNKNLELLNEKELPSKEMYKGVTWNAYLNAEKNFNKIESTKLLISSAGYGLIDSSQKIKSYGITFSKKNQDSISNIQTTSNINSNSLWWDGVNKFDINTLNPNSKIFIAVSYDYLISMNTTIHELIKKFDKNIFIIVVSKKKLPKLYSDYLLRFDTRFNNFSKGTFNTIIARFIQWLSNEIYVNKLQIEHKLLQNHIDNFLNTLNKYQITKGLQQEDTKILEIIKKQINEKNIKSKTQGLKDFRQMGLACEQKRYGRLFESLKEEKE